MITSPNLLGTLAGLQDTLARAAGVGQFSDLHADRQSILNGWLELALEEFWNERDWTWGKIQGTALECKTLYTTGTVSVNAGQASVTGVGTNWVDGTNLDVNRSFLSLGEQDGGMYQITAVGGTTSLTMSPTLGGSNNISGDTYEIGTPDYALAADAWGLLNIRDVYDGGTRLQIETYDHWLARTAGVWYTGRPTHAVLLDGAGDNTSPNLAVRLWPVPDDTYRYTYSYYKVPTWPTNFDSAPQSLAPLVYKALELRDIHQGQLESAAAWERKYNQAVMKAAKRDVIRSPKTRHRLSPSWGGTMDYSDMQIIDDDTGTSDA